MNDNNIEVIFWYEKEINDIYNFSENLAKRKYQSLFDVPGYNEVRDNEKINFILKYLDKNKNHIPLRSIFRILKIRYNAKLGIVEYPYIDDEYLESFGNYYSKSFKNFAKYCYRIHFLKIVYRLKLKKMKKIMIKFC